MYLLDSCTISHFMKGEENTAKKLKSLSPSVIYTTTISQMEILHGLLRKFDREHRYFKIFAEFMEQITVLPFDNDAALHSAQIRTTLEKRGNIIGAYDILIAGICLADGLILVTSNGREFRRVDDLQIENWRGE